MVCNFDKVVTHNFSNLPSFSLRLVKVEMMSILTLYLIFFLHSKGLKETREKPILKERWPSETLKNHLRMTWKDLITIWVTTRVSGHTHKKYAFLMNDMNLAFLSLWAEKVSSHD